MIVFSVAQGKPFLSALLGSSRPITETIPGMPRDGSLQTPHRVPGLEAQGRSRASEKSALGCQVGCEQNLPLTQLLSELRIAQK